MGGVAESMPRQGTKAWEHNGVSIRRCPASRQPATRRPATRQKECDRMAPGNRSMPQQLLLRVVTAHAQSYIVRERCCSSRLRCGERQHAHPLSGLKVLWTIPRSAGSTAHHRILIAFLGTALHRALRRNQRWCRLLVVSHVALLYIIDGWRHAMLGNWLSE